MNLHQLIQNCQKAKSHAEIRRLLHQHKDNAVTKLLFQLMLDKSIIYNIKAVPQYPETNPFKSIKQDDDLLQPTYYIKPELRELLEQATEQWKKAHPDWLF